MFVLDKKAIKLYYKIRHRHGHGIHSPFVFNFIVNVIENKIPFYAFEDIRRYIREQSGKHTKTYKLNKLLFKTINYFSLKNILVIGSQDGIDLLYATSPSKEINCLCAGCNQAVKEKITALLDHWNRKIALSDELPAENQLFDCIVIDLKHIPDIEMIGTYIFKHIDEKSVVILNNIRTNNDVSSLVKNIGKDERVRISLDLYTTNILFFDKKYFKRNYKISF